MGLTSLHGQLTVSVLTKLGFSEGVAQIAAEANEAVDVDANQGSDARLTNLHAMRGFVQASPQSMQGRTMQTVEQARTAVEALLAAAQQSIVDAIPHVDPAREPSKLGVTLNVVRDAAVRLGAALHTVQDREYHHYEAWPWESLADSLANPWKGDAYGLPRHYMLQCHGPRDVGYVNGLLNLSLTALDFSVEYNNRGGWSAGGRLEGTQVSTNPWIPHLSIGLAAQANGQNGNEWIGYGLLTWGRIPSRPAAGMVRPRMNSGTLTIQRPATLCPEGSEGANSLIAARAATIAFVNAVSKLVPPADWEQFKAAKE